MDFNDFVEFYRELFKPNELGSNEVSNKNYVCSRVFSRKFKNEMTHEHIDKESMVEGKRGFLPSFYEQHLPMTRDIKAL